MQQISTNKTHAQDIEYRPVERDSKQSNVWWVRSFSPRKTQLWYKVVLRADTDEIYCSCPQFGFHPETLCKHQMRVLQLELGSSGKYV